jgi:hypothetical protein
MYCVTKVNLSSCDKQLSVTGILEECHHLQELRLRYYWGIKDVSISRITEGWLNLLSLNLSNCENLSEMSMIKDLSFFITL